jgi:hypothetical protein
MGGPKFLKREIMGKNRHKLIYTDNDDYATLSDTSTGLNGPHN